MLQLVTNAQLTEAIQRHRDMVYAIALSKTRQAADADDVFQEVFLKLVRYAASIKNEAHLKAWLIRVTLNICNSHFRSGWVKRMTSYDDKLLKSQDLKDYYTGEHLNQDPDESFLGADVIDEADDEQRAQLFRAVSLLPDIYKEPVHLHYYQELSIREVALILRARDSAVKQRLSRARDMIRKSLGRM